MAAQRRYEIVDLKDGTSPESGGGERKILTIGGGSGQYALLSGLRDAGGLRITSVVSMADNGGSSGRLRHEFGILPPGDALKCIVALSPFRGAARRILLKRLNGSDRMNGHNAGNMLLAMLAQYAGSFPAGIQSLSECLEIYGRVLPSTTDKATLVAELADGKRIYGESAIDKSQDSIRENITKVFLVPHHGSSISAYEPVVEEIHESDYIIIGPGDLFTSIVATLAVPGIREAFQKTRANVLYVLNIMTKFGETHRFGAYDFVQTIERYIHRPVDGIICNMRKPSHETMENYLRKGAEFVSIKKDRSRFGDRTVYEGDLLDTSGEKVRHDPEKLASAIISIVFPEIK